jgi:tRNA(adenine34) deaminase
MRDTVGYRPRRKKPWRPDALRARQTKDSFAYAGGDIHQPVVPSGFKQPGLSPDPEPAPVAPPPPESAQAKSPQLKDIMDNPSQNAPQEIPNDAQPVVRRKRTFPVTFRVRKDEHGKPVESQMYYAHEWEAFQASQAAAERAQKEADEAAKAAREAELAAGRPDPVRVGILSERSESKGPQHPAFASQTSAAKSTFVASTPVIHAINRTPPDSERHSRLCSVCSHPDRDAIEGDFVRWRKPREIIDDYGLSSRSAFYRHVHATGLFQRRRFELARVLETRLEEADDCPLEQFDIITRAARVYAHLDDNGRWFEPPRTHHILTGSLPLPSDTPPDSARPGSTPPDPPPTFDIALNLPNPKVTDLHANPGSAHATQGKLRRFASSNYCFLGAPKRFARGRNLLADRLSAMLIWVPSVLIRWPFALARRSARREGGYPEHRANRNRRNARRINDIRISTRNSFHRLDHAGWKIERLGREVCSPSSCYPDARPGTEGAAISENAMSQDPTSQNPMTEKDDARFMQAALEEARAAAERGEVPVGAVAVAGGAIVARAGNRTIADCDPTAHAEMIALREAAAAAGNYRLVNATIYVTIEPCAMCAGAMIQARVARLVYGADDPKAGAVRSCFCVLDHPKLNHRVEVTPGVLEEEAAALLREFFAVRR